MDVTSLPNYHLLGPQQRAKDIRRELKQRAKEAARIRNDLSDPEIEDTLAEAYSKRLLELQEQATACKQELETLHFL